MKLTLQQQTKLQRFLVAMQDKELLPGDAFWVNQLLEKCAEARVLYIQSVHIGSHLNWDFGITPGDADYPEEKLILGEPPNPELLKSSSIKRPKKRRKKAKEVSFYSSQKTKIALLVIAPLLLLGFFWGGFHLVQATFFNNGIATKNDMLQIGKMRELTEGELELSFPTGSQVVLIAPVKFVVTGENSIRLLSGKLVANVPTSGIGFQVDTPRGRVVDLGTIFSVHATKELNTIVQVFRGKVIASFVDSNGVVKTSKPIHANQATRIDFIKENLVDIPYASNNFVATLQKEYGIAQHSRTVLFQEKTPELLAEEKDNSFQQDDLVFVFPEKKNVLLTENLRVGFDKTGSYRFLKDLPPKRGTIPANTTVDCFRIHYTPKNKTGKTETIYGEIHFDRPVLGLINTPDDLAETDLLFYPDWEKLSNQSISHSGIEVYGIDKSSNSDEITLSEDRKTLTFKLLAITGGNMADEFRVLIQAKQ